MIEKLCNQIWNRPGFQSDYLWISTTGAKIHFLPGDTIDEEGLIAIHRMIQCALTFSLSSSIDYRQVAYEIAVNSKNIIAQYKMIGDATRKKEEAAIALIFSRLGNFPAETKYIEETNISLQDEVPSAVWFDREYHIAENTIRVTGHKSLALTDFQLQLWDAITNHSVVIVNAPTSAGKSFVLQNHIINSIVNGVAKNAIYIVPTRALIEQVIKELRSICRNIFDETIEITITEVPNTDAMGEYNVFVLTQERTQLLMDYDIDVDLVVIDEAQNVSDNARGVILQSVIEKIKDTTENAKFIFATPYVSKKLAYHMKYILKIQMCQCFAKKNCIHI